MRIFVDEQGHEWQLSLTAATLRRFKAADVDAIKFYCEEFDIEMLVRVLWVWLEPQIDALGINEDEFAERLHGEAIAKAYSESRDEVIDFLSHMNPPLAQLLRKAVIAAEAVNQKVAELADKISLPSASTAVSV